MNSREPNTRARSSRPDTADVVAAALDYARWGFSVLAVDAEKKPVPRRWKERQSVRADEPTIRTWYFDPRAVGVGIVLGEVSGGLVVRDFDAPGSYERWAAAHPDLAAVLPTVKTGRGYHVYARFATDARSCRTRTYPDGELRGNGAYVVAPPSPHPSGVLYWWAVPMRDGDVPEVDPSVFDSSMDTRSEPMSPTLPPANQEYQEDQEDQEGQEGQEQQAPHEWPESPACLESLEALAPLASLGLHADAERFVDQAIAATLPRGVGERNKAIFRFARRLKGNPDLASLPLAGLRHVVTRWHVAALPRIGTTDFDSTWADFTHAWGRVRTPFGAALAEALEVARAAPDPPCAAAYGAPSTRLLIRLCVELQRRHAPGPFFLAASAAAWAVELEPASANRRLGMLVSDCVLALVKRGYTGHASEYLFIGS